MRHILIYIVIIFVVCVLGWGLLFWIHGHSPNMSASPSTVPADVASVNQGTKRSALPKLTDTQKVDPDAFYQTIIDNNIFRPLDWEPVQHESTYRLLGTAIATDGSSAKAYIQERKSDRFYAVSVGEQVGKMTVKTITSKWVTLTQNGESLTLAISSVPFLNPSGNPIRDSTMSYFTKAGPPKNDTSKRSTKPTQQSNAASEWRKHLEEKAAKIRAERKRMTEYLKQHQSR